MKRKIEYIPSKMALKLYESVISLIAIAIGMTLRKLLFPPVLTHIEYAISIIVASIIITGLVAVVRTSVKTNITDTKNIVVTIQMLRHSIIVKAASSIKKQDRWLAQLLLIVIGFAYAIAGAASILIVLTGALIGMFLSDMYQKHRQNKSVTV